MPFGWILPPVEGHGDLVALAVFAAISAAHHPGAGLVLTKHLLHGVGDFTDRTSAFINDNDTFFWIGAQLCVMQTGRLVILIRVKPCLIMWAPCHSFLFLEWTHQYQCLRCFILTWVGLVCTLCVCIYTKIYIYKKTTVCM